VERFKTPTKLRPEGVLQNFRNTKKKKKKTRTWAAGCLFGGVGGGQWGRRGVGVGEKGGGVAGAGGGGGGGGGVGGGGTGLGMVVKGSSLGSGWLRTKSEVACSFQGFSLAGGGSSGVQSVLLLLDHGLFAMVKKKAGGGFQFWEYRWVQERGGGRGKRESPIGFFWAV